LFDIIQALEAAPSVQNTFAKEANKCQDSTVIQNADLASIPEIAPYAPKPEGLYIQARPSIRPSSEGILPTKWMLEIEPILLQTRQLWDEWVKNGLATCSPDFAPLFRRKSLLQQRTSPNVYKNLVFLINGQRTLRDIAVLMKQDVNILTRYLAPYIRQQLICLVSVPDLRRPSFTNPATPTTTADKSLPARTEERRKEGKLIACIDDSPTICHVLESILTQAGYRFVYITNAVDALSFLLRNQPDLIFLDLTMPIVNGYEICSQIRRIESFQNIPIIILTGNDGIIDRVRAKLVGASDFLSKPADAIKIVTTVKKYIP